MRRLIDGVMIGLISCALSAALAAQDSPEEQVPVPESVPMPDDDPDAGGDEVPVLVAPERRVVLGDPLTDEVSADELQRALAELAQRNPNWISVAELGRSKGDRPILLATLADHRSGRADERPGTLVVPHLSWTGGDSARKTYGFLLALLDWAARADDASPLGHGTFYVLVAPQPDYLVDPAASDAVPLRSVDPNRNFPEGWDPWVTANAGPYPLFDSETKLLADFAIARRNLCAALILEPRATRGVRFATTPAREDDLAFLSGFSATLARPEPGSLAAFLAAHTDSVVVDVDPLAFEREGEEEALGAFAQELIDQMPRIELGAPTIERIGPELWQLEGYFANAGKVATASKSTTGFATADLGLTVLGAPVVATAVSEDGPPGERRFAVVESVSERIPLGSLVGGEIRWVRLVVVAAPATVVSLRLVGARSGRAERTLTLK